MTLIGYGPNRTYGRDTPGTHSCREHYRVQVHGMNSFSVIRSDSASRDSGDCDVRRSSPALAQARERMHLYKSAAVLGRVHGGLTFVPGRIRV